MYIKKPSSNAIDFPGLRVVATGPAIRSRWGRSMVVVHRIVELRKVGVDVGQWWGAVAIGRRWATALLSDMVAIDGCAMSVVDGAGGCRGC